MDEDEETQRPRTGEKDGVYGKYCAALELGLCDAPHISMSVQGLDESGQRHGPSQRSNAVWTIQSDQLKG